MFLFTTTTPTPTPTPKPTHTPTPTPTTRKWKYGLFESLCCVGIKKVMNIYYVTMHKNIQIILIYIYIYILPIQQMAYFPFPGVSYALNITHLYMFHDETHDLTQVDHVYFKNCFQ